MSCITLLHQLILSMAFGNSNINISFKDREDLYSLIISQLFYDGYQALATNLASLVNFSVVCTPSDKLAHVVKEGLKIDRTQKDEDMTKSNDPMLGGIDFEDDVYGRPSAPEPCLYETKYVTSHKAPCRSTCFSNDGELIATGSVDTSIKILNVDKIMMRPSPGNVNSSMGGIMGHPPNPNNNIAGGASNTATATISAQELMQQNAENHPVIRTLYDHVGEVTSLQFHPTTSFLVSGSKDCTVKLYDFSKPTSKKALKVIQDCEPVNCISIHPSGEYVLVGTEQSTLRLYNLLTNQCFVSPQPSDQHNGPLSTVKYTLDGRCYVTASRDGDMRLWDGVSNRCVNHFPKAHDGFALCYAAFSKNGKYVLSTASDASIKLWELGASRCLMSYAGAGAQGKSNNISPAVFNHTEDYVLYPDENTLSLYSWETRSALLQSNLNLNHNAAIGYIQHSPTQPLFVTCSEDHRVRFMARRQEF